MISTPRLLLHSLQSTQGDFWPDGDPATAIRRLLHPGRDDLTLHLREAPSGLIVALTETGAFHLERLQLNRPPLVALRRSRQEVAHLREDLAAAKTERHRLRERVATLESDLIGVLSQVARLPET